MYITMREIPTDEGGWSVLSCVMAISGQGSECMPMIQVY